MGQSGRKTKLWQGELPKRSRRLPCKYCGKGVYLNRKEARAAGKAHHPGDHLSAYQCLQAPDHADTSMLWHYGHLSDLVIKKGQPRSFVHNSDGPDAPFYMVQPVIGAGHDTVPTVRIDNDNPQPEGGQMPTLGEVANLNLRGFDRDHGRYREVTTASSVKDRTALVHGALRAFALTHSFEEMKDRGQAGFVGRVSMRSLVRGLFQDLDGDQLDQAVKSITNSGNRAGLLRCLDSSQHMQGVLPIWWVAADYEATVGHPPLEEPGAVTKPKPKPKPAAKKTVAKKAPATKSPPTKPAPGEKKKFSGRAKGTRNRSRLDLLDLTELALEYLGRPVVLQELYTQADFPVKMTSLRDVLDELHRDGRAIRRQLNSKDREVLKASGGATNLGPRTWVWAHPSVADKRGRVPILTWGNPESEVAAVPVPEEAPVTAPEALEDHDEFLATEEHDEAMQEVVEALEDAQVATVLPMPAPAPPPLPPAPQIPAPPVDAFRTRIAELEAENAKLRKRVKALLSLAATMEDD